MRILPRGKGLEWGRNKHVGTGLLEEWGREETCQAEEAAQAKPGGRTQHEAGPYKRRSFADVRSGRQRVGEMRRERIKGPFAGTYVPREKNRLDQAAAN